MKICEKGRLSCTRVGEGEWEMSSVGQTISLRLSSCSYITERGGFKKDVERIDGATTGRDVLR